MKDIILEKINQLISEARRDKFISVEARTEVVNYLAELKVFVENSVI
jgi:hypothetical protein